MVCARLRGLTFLSTPSARRATLPRLSRASIWAFLSTPSARRATSLILMPLSFIAYFYPRPPRGWRRHRQGSGSGTGRISIHALREEGDQSTWKPVLSLPISIHALREEGDRCCQKYCPGCRYFYPRPPRGGRPSSALVLLIAVRFLSTPSARRATWAQDAADWLLAISIHALREEGDSTYLSGLVFYFNFYPRPPRGGRQPASSLDPVDG